jgi:peptidyl-tRNA hydrolase, PTH1 family
VSGYVIVGLGNPGRRYAGTRHNAGFLVVDALAERGGMHLSPSTRLRADVAEGRLGAVPGVRVVLAKPLTFMNDSGAAVAGVLRFYAGDLASGALDRLIVVHDEIDIPFGGLRVKAGGGDNGHNGLKSIRTSLKSGDFTRVRVGVGRPTSSSAAANSEPGDPRAAQRGDTAGWVLSDFSAAERRHLPELVERAADAVEHLTAHDLAETQSRFNS